MVKSKDGTRFPRKPKGKLSCERLKKLTQQVADYNFLNPLTKAQVNKANRWERMKRNRCYS